jgi:ribonuclease J
MRLRIHRGAHEIGGNCVEIESQGYSILFDLGLPLTADLADASLLPQIVGLTDGSNFNLLGVVLSHTHGDHNGLTGLVDASVPVFMGDHSRSLLLASQFFVRRSPVPASIRTYVNQTPFRG